MNSKKFRVEFKGARYSYTKFTFEFETLEEAQEFSKKAFENFVDEEKEGFEVTIGYRETMKQEKKEDE